MKQDLIFLVPLYFFCTWKYFCPSTIGTLHKPHLIQTPSILPLSVMRQTTVSALEEDHVAPVVDGQPGAVAGRAMLWHDLLLLRVQATSPFRVSSDLLPGILARREPVACFPCDHTVFAFRCQPLFFSTTHVLE